MDLLLGHVEAGIEGALNAVVSDTDAQLASGRFDLVGRVDPRTRRVEAGALAKNLGNDQWSVYLLNEEQLTSLVKSELTTLRADVSLAPVEGLQHEALAHVADRSGPQVNEYSGASLGTLGAHLVLGPGALLIEPALALGAAAFGGLGVAEPEERKIARKLALDGVGVGSAARVVGEMERAKAAPAMDLGLER